MSISSSRAAAPRSPLAAESTSKSCPRAKATSSRSSVLLLLLAGCKQILGLDEGSVVTDAPAVQDAVADMADECRDTDGDGLCNVDDPWPCGPEPADLPIMVGWSMTIAGDQATIELTDARLAGARKLVVAPGESVELTARYSIVDCLCP